MLSKIGQLRTVKSRVKSAIIEYGLSDAPPELVAAAFQIAGTTPEMLKPLLLPLAMFMLLNAARGVKKNFEVESIKEIVADLAANHGRLKNDIVTSDEFIKIVGKVLTEHAAELRKEKKQILQKYLVNLATGDTAILHDHENEILDVLMRISPRQYSQLCDIVTAYADLQRDIVGRPGLSLIRLNELAGQLARNDAQATPASRLPSLNIVVRSLASLNLIQIRDVGVSSPSGPEQSLEISYIPPLTYWLIEHVSPGLISRVLLSEEIEGRVTTVLHDMKLEISPFNEICGGRKRLEIRLFDDKRKKIRVGDQIKFHVITEPSRTVTVRVTSLESADSFLRLFGSIDLVAAGFPADLSPQIAAEQMRRFYTVDQEAEFGVIAIGVTREDK